MAVEQIAQACKYGKTANAENDNFLIFKSALETILSSNLKLNKYRDVVFGDFLQFGTSLEMTNIRFDNFLSWARIRTSMLSGEVAQGGKKEMRYIEQEVDVFRIFLFLDFSARLLENKKDLTAKSYLSAKNIALWLLCTNGYISERREIRDDPPRKMLKEISETVLQNKNAGINANAQLSSLFRFDFPCALQYFLSLDIDTMLAHKTSKGKPFTKEFELQSICNFLEILERNHCYDDKKLDYIAIGKILEEHSEMAEKIGNHLQENKRAMYVSTIYQDYFSKEFAVYGSYQKSVEKMLTRWRHLNG